MPDNGRRPNVVAIALIGIVAVALVAVVIGLLAGGDDDGDVAIETSDVEVAGGDDLAPFDDTANPDPAVGLPAPVLSGADFDGEPITVPGDGPAVVVFLAHWCPHCQREVPVLVDWLEENGQPDGVELFGVATSIDPDADNYPPSEWLEDEGWLDLVPTLVDAEDSGGAAAYGLTSFPYFVAIDEDGNVAGRASGELTTEQFEQVIDLARGGG
jgi:cytochrome c biogenesis protein CcmG/thiol:disulfide interchange protein DsbE